MIDLLRYCKQEESFMIWMFVTSLSMSASAQVFKCDTKHFRKAIVVGAECWVMLDIPTKL